MSFLGLLNSYCNIQEVSKSQNTSGQKIDTWSIKYFNVKCRLNPLTGSEINVESTVLYRATHKLFLDNKYTLINKTGLYRIKIGTKFYDIVDVKNASGQNHHLELILVYRG